MKRGRCRWAITRRRWEDVDCWVLDLELSGLDPARGCIVAVGMVPMRDRVIRVGHGFATLVRPTGPCDMSGVAAHHLLPDQLAAAPPLEVVLEEIDGRLAEAVLVVHAGEIDLPFLRRAYGDTGRAWPDPPVVDTVRLLRRHDRHRLVDEPLETTVPARLATARARMGLPPSEAHDAFADAVATAELLLVLVHRLGVRTVGDLL